MCSVTRCIRPARWSHPNRLRFDFHHQGAISEGDLQTIEEEINARVRENAPVPPDEMAYNDAIKAGALAFFGDKYGDVVRVIRMGDFSVELCGGTHVDATGQIGMFKLEAESGIAAGVRRVEALTGQGALEAVRKREKILEDIGHYLGARDAQALDRLEKLVAREKELEKKLRALEQKLASGATDGATSGENVVVANGVKIVTRKLEGIEAASLREIADKMRQKHGSCVAVVGSNLGDKVALVVAVTPDLAGEDKGRRHHQGRSRQLSAAPAEDVPISRKPAAKIPRSWMRPSRRSPRWYVDLNPRPFPLGKGNQPHFQADRSR